MIVLNKSAVKSLHLQDCVWLVVVGFFAGHGGLQLCPPTLGMGRQEEVQGRRMVAGFKLNSAM